MNLTLSLTHNCQFRCDYCYAGQKYHKPISKETILKAIEFTLQIPMRRLEFGFFGGEPLMEWELFKFATCEMERETKKRDIELIKTFTTNGVLLDSEKVAWLREHGFYVVVSIDGDEVMHDTHRRYRGGKSTFTDVKIGIEELQKVYRDDEYAVISVVTPQNIHRLNSSVRYLYEEMGISDIHLALNYFTEWGDETEEYSKVYHLLGDYVIEQYRNNKKIAIDIIDGKIRSAIEAKCSSCSFGELKIAVAPSGNIYPCERLIGEDSGELSIGNVYSGFDHSRRNELISQRGNSNEECKTCPLKDRCTNSCGCTNYTLTNSINTTNGVVCFFQKLFIEVADRVGATLYEEKNIGFLERFYGE